MLKRPLPVYDDIQNSDHEEGELYESELSDVDNNTAFSSDDEMAAKAVLPVGRFDVNFKLGDEPTSGEQYLCLVRHERTRLPKTEVSPCTSTAKTLDEILAGRLANTEYLVEVDQTWAEHYWTQYCRYVEIMRAQMEAVEQVHVVFPEDKKSSESWLKFVKETELSLDVCVALAEDQSLVWKLLSFMPGWLEGDDKATVVSWMHSLLLCLERQLSSNQISVLRGLVKSLARFQDSTIKELILIIVKTYGQHDLIKLV